MINYSKLDNPVWHALSETHKEYALKHDGIRFYHPDYCPFGAINRTGDITQKMNDYARYADSFFIVGEKPEYHGELELKKELICLQMTISSPLPVDYPDEIVSLSEYKEEIFHLVNLVQPGYFRKKTNELGDYFGIFKAGVLVAVTGERMQLDLFTEVSAVVTHPDHSGKGYAKQLVAFVVNKIFAEGKYPFLHVAESNIAAVKLYEKLGFSIRRKISFWNYVRSLKFKV